MLKDLVLRILNQTVGEYFENIDASQLQLSVFGGDVALHDVSLKSNVFESLGLPFRLSAGKCGTLTLKIPWTSLYSQPVEISLKDLYLLVVPGSSIAYDDEVESKFRLKAKLRLIENIESAQKEYAASQQIDPTVEEKDQAGYLEKLAMQIVRNLQIRIESIHMLYEDDQANPGKPFAVGAVLSNLSILTTDVNWTPKYVSENVSTIHKLLNLEGLALYWNSDAIHLSQTLSTEPERVEKLKNLLERGRFDYMVGPISTMTKLNLTPNPEKGAHPFTVPKMKFDTVVQELALGMSNLQFQDVLQLAESMDFLYRRQQYRKYRPHGTPYSKNYRVWWKFAYKCILEDIQRKRNNWRWIRMRIHRKDCKNYYAALYKKTVSKKVSPELDEEIGELESRLDVFNILLIRKQVDLRRERKEKEEADSKKNRGWFSGWFATQPDGKGEVSDGPLGLTLTEMSSEEKTALYSAIGYSETNTPPALNYPSDYVGTHVDFRLDKLKFIITRDDRRKFSKSSARAESRDRETILELQIIRFETLLETRPVKNALKVGLKLGSIEAFGGAAPDSLQTVLGGQEAGVQNIPHIVAARKVEGVDYFIDMGFETSPLNSNLDQRLYLYGQPLEITYDARTTQKLLECLTLPQQVSLQRLQAKALSKYIEWKAHSTVGIMRMVENRGKVEIDVHLEAPYIIVPQNGLLSLASSVLVIELGELLIKSKPPDGTLPLDNPGSAPQPSVVPGGREPAAVNSAVLQLSYDTFLVELRDFQVTLAFAGEIFRTSRTSINPLNKSKSLTKKLEPIHLVKSGVVIVRIEQCIVPDDARFPKIKIYSRLPLVDFDIPEHRLVQLVNLIVTLPLPKSPSESGSSFTSSETELNSDASLNESLAVTQIAFMDVKQPSSSTTVLADTLEQQQSPDPIQITALLVEVSIEAIKIRVSKLDRDRKEVEPMMALELYSLTANLVSKSFGTSVDVKLGGVTMSAVGPDSYEPLYLIRTPRSTKGIDCLFHIHIFTITPDCPKAQAMKIKQHINLDVASMDTVLHREVLLTIVDFMEQLATHVAQEMTALERHLEEQITRTGKSRSISGSQLKQRVQKSAIALHTQAVAKKFGSDPNEVLLKVEARLNKLTVVLATNQKNIMKIEMGNLDGSFIQRTPKLEMFMQLKEFKIINLDPSSCYKNIVTVEAERVIFIHVTKYNEQSPSIKEKEINSTKCDMRIKIETGSPKIYILGSFLVELLNFSNQFQTATKAVKRTSAAAAEAAKKNVQQAYGNDLRISLNVDLQAPKIMLPENDRSLTALMFDFGNLNFSNSFSSLKTKYEGKTVYAVVDEMEIAIENVKVSRVIIDNKTQEAICEVLLLDPVTFTGKVRRNLSAEWYKGIPAVSLKGKLHSTVIRLSSEDFEVVRGAILDKLGAMGNDIPIKSDTPSVESTLGIYTLEQQKGTAEDFVDSIHDLSLAMELSLNNLGAVLYQGSSKMEGKKGLILRDENNSLAQFLIDSVRANVSVTNADHLKCNVILGNLDLKDSRVGRGKSRITNLIQRRETEYRMEPVAGSSVSPAALVPMIQFVAEKTPSEISINLTTTSLTFLLCLEHVTQVVKFLNPSFRSEVQVSLETAQQQQADSSKYHRKTALTPREARQLKELKSVSVVKAEARSLSIGDGGDGTPLKAHFKLAALELVFVENMETIHTNAVLLNCEMSLDLKSAGEITEIVGMIDGVQLSTCNFHPDHRNQSLVEVISPTTVIILGKNSTQSGLDLDVNASDVFVRLSAGTVELFTKIAESFKVSDSDQSENSELLDYSEIWRIQKVEERGFWYLEPDAINEHNCSKRDVPGASKFEDKEVTMLDVEDSHEKLVFKSGSIVLTFEAGSEVITAPLLLIEAAVEFQAMDWSLELEIAGKIQLAAAYFNAKVGMWEYLIEPLPKGEYRSASWRPLELLFGINKGETDEFSRLVRESTSSVLCLNQSEGVKRGSEIVCTFQCNDVMEFTLTKTSMHVLTMFAETFNVARKSLVTKREISTAPYVIENYTGIDLLVDLTDTPFQVEDSSTGEVQKKFRLISGFQLELSMANDYARYSILKEQQTEEDRWIRVAMQSAAFQSRIPISKAEVRCFPLKSGDVMTTEVWVKDCSRVITFRGAVQIFNDLNVEVDILTKDLIHVGTIRPNKIPFNVPLKHLKCGGFVVAPSRFKYSTQPFDLNQPGTNGVSSKVTKYLTCPDYVGAENFYIKVVSNSKQVLLENTKRLALNNLNYEIHLSPPLLINNMLPSPLAYVSSSSTGEELEIAEKGRMIQVTNLPANAASFDIPLRVKGYDSLNWECRISVSKKTEALSAWTFVCTTESRMLTLGINKDYSIDEQLILHVYAPFWMINRTGFNLTYRGEKDTKQLTRHPVDRPIVLFSYPSAEVFSKTNKARMKPDEADWCAPFATETVGLSSFLSSKSARKDYQFGLSIKLCHGGLTKMIIFSPKYYLMNQCSYSVNITEESSSEELILPSNLCVPFWPKGADPRLRVGVDGTLQKTEPFFYEIGHSTLLRLDNQYGGIQVDVNVGDTRVVITLIEYSRGKAPNLLLNVTGDMKVGIRQEGQPSSVQSILKPGESQLLCWPEPTKNRTLFWYPLAPDDKPVAAGKEFKDTLGADSFLEFEWTNAEGEKGRYFWISFIEELQRVTVIAKNELLVRYLKTARDLELPTAEVVLMFTGLGISLVDNMKCKELIYLRMSSSGVIWEDEVAPGKVRPFSKEDSDALEMMYQSYANVNLPSAARGRTIGVFKLDSGMEVDLKAMRMIKPHERPIRRCPKQPGLWSHIQIFPHSTQCHLKINRLQIDNQLPDATFLFLVSPVAVAKSVATNESERKPFVELVFVQGRHAHSSLQYVHCSFLVQEFQVKMDMGLINSLVEMFSQEGSAKVTKIMEDFKDDYNLATMSDEEHQKRTVVSVGSKRFYNYLHLSPLKVRVSFSMNGSSTDVNNVFLLLLQGLGMDKLADFQDVPFQLACFELRSKLLSDDQLASMVTSHYTTQGLKQFYVLILGLDFLGNPYALITGITEGIGAFFYEPIQGAILGPDAFKEGLSLGVKSLVGHTVGGAAEALSKMTGTIGKGFAAMTWDDDFQRQRKEAMRQGPQGSSFANTAKGFFKTGIIDTVAGLVTNPLKGAQEEGITGFGKGLFKGALGMVTRPVVGAADLTRGTLDSFRRAIQEGDDLDQIRAPRPVQCSSALQPYNIHSGRGYQIMMELARNNRGYLKFESYLIHVLLDKQVLLVTDRRVFFLKLTDAYGGSSVIWEHEWKDFAMPPYVVEKGMELQIKLPGDKANPFGKPNPASQLFVRISDPEICMWIMNEIEKLINAEESSDDPQQQQLP